MSADIATGYSGVFFPENFGFRESWSIIDLAAVSAAGLPSGRKIVTARRYDGIVSSAVSLSMTGSTRPDGCGHFRRANPISVIVYRPRSTERGLIRKTKTWHASIAASMRLS